MKSIFILCGAPRVGKTKTLKVFFNVDIDNKLPPSYLLTRFLKNRLFCTVGVGSPQELVGFCKVEDVKKNIEKRISRCDRDLQSQDYVLIMPFTIRRNRKNEYNENCLIKPIEWLKEKKFNVIIAYLRKKEIRNVESVDEIMKKLAAHYYQIDSNEEYSRQAKAMENIILKTF